MASVGSLIINIVANAEPLNRAIRNAERNMRAFVRDIEKNGTMIEQALARAVHGSRMMAAAAVRFGAVGAAALSGVGFMAIRAAANMEQTKIAFETLLGSAQEADKFIREMQAFAARTPFQFEGLAQAARQLLAYRFAAEQILPMMAVIGDAAAAMGGGQEIIDRIVRTFGQIRAKGRLQGEELLQLAEAGVNAYQYLADALGVSVARATELVSRGAVDAQTAINAILRGMEKDFAGSMERQSRTILGQWSTLKDNINIILTGIGEHMIKALDISGILDRVGRRLGELAEKVAQVGWAEAWKQIAPSWLEPALIGIAGAVAGALIPSLWALSRTLWQVAASAIAALIPLWPWLVAGAAVALGVWYLVKRLRSEADAMGKAADTQKAMSKTAEQAAEGQDKLADGMKAVNKAVGKNIQSFDEVHLLQEEMASSATASAQAMASQAQAGAAVVPGGVTGMEELQKQAGGWIQEFGQLWAGLVDGIKQAWAAFFGWAGGLWDGIKQKWAGFKEWVLGWAGPLWDGIEAAWNIFVSWAGKLWDGIKTAWEWFKGWVISWAGPLWDEIKAAWTAFIIWAGRIWDTVQFGWSLFVIWAARMWENVKLAWGLFIAWLTQTWTAVTTWLSQKWGWLKTAAETVWGLITSSIVSAVLAAWDWLTQAWSAISAGLSGTWEFIRAAAETVWGLIKDHVIGPIQAVWDWLVVAWDTIAAWLSGKWERIKTIAGNLWEGVKSGIVSSIQAAWSWLSVTWNTIATWLSDKWGWIKRTANTAWQGVKNFIQSPMQAVNDWMGPTWERIAGRLADIWENIKRKAANVWDGVKNAIKGAINGIIGIINKFIRAFNRIEIRVPRINIPFVGAVGGWSIRVPQIPEIPMLAAGGLVTDPTLAMLGERGPEAVVPLSRDNVLADSIAKAVYQAVVDGFRITQAGQQQADREVVLRIDSTNFARLILPAIIKEGQRQGLNLVVRPAGVV